MWKCLIHCHKHQSGKSLHNKVSKLENVCLPSGTLKESYLWKLISFLLKTYKRDFLLLSFEEAARGNVRQSQS